MLSGLPASGKSTIAKEIISQGNWVRVNRDLLRKMLYSGTKWTGKKEDLVIDSEKEIVKVSINKNYNVVIDDCNMSNGHLERWKTLANEMSCQFEHRPILTDMQTCLDRDLSREEPVGRHVIEQMALQYQRYPNISKPLVICDIDGTIANIEHRLHFVKKEHSDEIMEYKKDWNSFFEHVKFDTPRIEIIRILNNFLREGHDFVFVSGRPERCRKDTIQWLYENVYSRQEWTSNKRALALLMRPDHDKRPDNELKTKIYQKFLSHYEIKVVIDDRPRVIEAWKKLGLTVMDVGKGIDF